MVKYVFLLLLLFLYSGCNQNTDLKNNTVNEQIHTQPISYSEIKLSTSKMRNDLFTEYEKYEENPDNQKLIIKKAQDFLINNINLYFEAWYNTPWSFNGTSREPKEGSIACGYFVTTILLDMGFKIPRVKWAQSASQTMITNINKDVAIFSNKPISEVEKYIRKNGEGVYLVGLDSHVGFIYYHNKEIFFVHSNYYRKNIGVMKENLSGKNPLNDSKYRVIGKIFTEEMTKKWILNRKF